MKQEILARLKSAEGETADRLQKARDQAQQIVREAGRQAAQLVQDADVKARQEAEAKVAQERGRLEKERERILAKGSQDEQALRKHYQAHVADAVENAVRTFEGHF